MSRPRPQTVAGPGEPRSAAGRAESPGQGCAGPEPRGTQGGPYRAPDRREPRDFREPRAPREPRGHGNRAGHGRAIERPRCA